MIPDLIPPKLAFNKVTVTELPIYRKSDTWETYLRMIQSPDRLNEVVRTMKLSHSSSSSIDNIEDNIKDNTKDNSNDNVNGNTNDTNDHTNGYNSNKSFNHTLRRESLHLQQKAHIYDNYV